MPPACTSTVTSVVELHSSVPSDSGASVGISNAATRTAPTAIASLIRAFMPCLPFTRHPVPPLLRGGGYHAQRIRIALDERGQVRLRLLEADVRRKRRHVRIGHHLEHGRALGGERPLPGGPDVFGPIDADAAEADQARVL